MTKQTAAAGGRKAKRAQQDTPAANGHEGALMMVPLNQIQLKEQVRTKADDAKFKELVQSVKQQGVIQAILLRKPPHWQPQQHEHRADNASGRMKLVWDVFCEETQTLEHSGYDTKPEAQKRCDEYNRYVVVAGERRFLAAQKAGLKEIPAIVREKMTEGEALLAQMTENLQREDLTPMDEAQAYDQMCKVADIKAVQDLAARVGKDEQYVRLRLQLLQLIEPAQKSLKDGKLPLGHALEIARLGPETQEKALEWAFSSHLRNNGKPVPVRLHELQEKIRRTNLNLSSAPWKLDQMVGDYKYGRCVGCKFNTTTDGALFADMAQGHCTNAVAFEEKMKAWYFERTKEILAETGKEPVFIADIYSIGQYERKAYNLPKETKGKGDYVEIARKAVKCKSAQLAIIVYGPERGHTRTVCVDRKCKDHLGKHGSSITSGSRSHSTQTPEERNKRKQELFDLRVTEPVRRIGIKRAVETFKWPLKREEFNRVAVRLYDHLPGFTQRVVMELSGDIFGAGVPDYLSYDGTGELETYIAKMTDKQLAQFFLLCAVAEIGENEGLHTPSNPDELKEIRAFIESRGVDYALLDAEERERTSPKKYHQAHMEYLQKVKQSDKHPKVRESLKPPKVYGDTSQPILPEKGAAKKAAKKSARKK
jgi:ParB/RepB/Spo0J family partition protein